jgi:hypothetical protein
MRSISTSTTLFYLPATPAAVFLSLVVFGDRLGRFFRGRQPALLEQKKRARVPLLPSPRAETENRSSAVRGPDAKNGSDAKNVFEKRSRPAFACVHGYISDALFKFLHQPKCPP